MVTGVGFCAVDESVDILGRENGKISAHAHLEVDIVPQCFGFNAALALERDRFKLKRSRSNLYV
jgi:hypothetical protein